MEAPSGAQMLEINGARIEVTRQGTGRPILFLHPHIGMHRSEALIARLAQRAEVIAPSHPGFGRSDLPKGMSSVDDMSYLYLELLEQLDLRDVLVVGASLGGWLAAEIVTKTTQRLSRLVMIGAVGVKLGPREQSDIVDIFATPRSRWEELSFHDAKFAQRDYDALSEDELMVIARNREATALFAWNPYMYNPKLKHRLHRIRVPVLFLWGASDRFASPEYGRGYCAAIPGATFETLPEAGHFPHIEQPEAVARRIIEFGLQRQMQAA
jgi:pimeloyl-ACP methyl ester carboxylesterase